jgi:hypothetical protein
VTEMTSNDVLVVFLGCKVYAYLNMITAIRTFHFSSVFTRVSALWSPL